MSEELKPCPFCGGEADSAFYSDDYRIGNVCYVRCTNCRIHTQYYNNKEVCIEDWNRRTSPWHTGKPTEEGDYLVIVEFKKGDTNYDTDYWVNGAWDWYYNQDGVCKIVAWQKIEPYKESEE